MVKQENMGTGKRRGVVVLHNEGCPATPKTIELIKECIGELGIHIDLRTRLVATREEAEAWRFLGSPTVQVDGIDRIIEMKRRLTPMSRMEQ